MGKTHLKMILCLTSNAVSDDHEMCVGLFHSIRQASSPFSSSKSPEAEIKCSGIQWCHMLCESPLDVRRRQP